VHADNVYVPAYIISLESAIARTRLASYITRLASYSPQHMHADNVYVPSYINFLGVGNRFCGVIAEAIALSVKSSIWEHF